MIRPILSPHRIVALLCLLAGPVAADGQVFTEDVDATVHVPGGAGCTGTGFGLATASCGRGDATATIATTRGYVTTTFVGSAADGTGISADGYFIARNATFAIVGPVTPARVVFYVMMQETETGPAGDPRNRNFAASIIGGPSFTFTEGAGETQYLSGSVAYAGPLSDFGVVGNFTSYFTAGTTVVQSFQILGVDALDGSGNSLADVDQVLARGVVIPSRLGVPPNFPVTAAEPGSLAMLGTGLIGLLPFARRRLIG